MQNYFTDNEVSVKEISISRITKKVKEIDLSLFKKPSWRALADSWQDIIEEEKLIEKRKESLREEIIAYADDKDIRSDGIVVRKRFRKGNVDYSKVPELAAVDLDKYRKKDSIFWTIQTNEVKYED